LADRNQGDRKKALRELNDLSREMKERRQALGGAEKIKEQLRKLDKTTAKRLVSFLREVVADSAGPRTRGKPLAGPLRGLWRYRVGDYRVICELIDERLVVLVVRLGHRSRIYN
jgi:mRNA interferase RelE/StbE